MIAASGSSANCWTSSTAWTLLVSSQPSVATQPVAGVDAEDELAGILRDHVAEPLGLLQRRGAEDDARQAEFEQRLDRRFVADAAAEFALHVDGREDRADRVEIHRLARAGAVEIDQVQMPGARRAGSRRRRSPGRRRRPSRGRSRPAAAERSGPLTDQSRAKSA